MRVETPLTVTIMYTDRGSTRICIRASTPTDTA